MTSDRPRRADAQRNRELILDAAAAVLSREADPTLSMIAEGAGVSRATIYRHFSDVAAVREALLEEVNELAKGILQQQLLSDSRAPFADRLVAMVRESLPIRTRYSEAMAREPVADAGALAMFTPIAAVMIRQAQAKHEIRADLDPQLMAETLITVGFYAARRVHRDGVPIEEAIQIVEVMMRGMEPGPPRG